MKGHFYRQFKRALTEDKSDRLEGTKEWHITAIYYYPKDNTIVLTPRSGKPIEYHNVISVHLDRETTGNITKTVTGGRRTSYFFSPPITIYLEILSNGDIRAFAESEE